jgi:hypothetical protein
MAVPRRQGSRSAGERAPPPARYRIALVQKKRRARCARADAVAASRPESPPRAPEPRPTSRPLKPLAPHRPFPQNKPTQQPPFGCRIARLPGPSLFPTKRAIGQNAKFKFPRGGRCKCPALSVLLSARCFL